MIRLNLLTGLTKQRFCKLRTLDRVLTVWLVG